MFWFCPSLTVFQLFLTLFLVWLNLHIRLRFIFDRNALNRKTITHEPHFNEDVVGFHTFISIFEGQWEITIFSDFVDIHPHFISFLTRF